MSFADVLRNMTWQVWASLLVVAGLFVGLQRGRNTPPELLFLGGVVLLALLGVLSPEQALSGFSNSAMLFVGALFVIAAGLRSTGVLDWLGHRLLGAARTENAALGRLTWFEIILSAFVPNTPVVALLVPVVLDWCRQRGISPSRLLLPVSYLAVLGGVCTLIGTSTNLVTHGLLIKAHDQAVTRTVVAHEAAFAHELRGMTMFEMGYVGMPCAVAGAAFLWLAGRRFLPDRTDLIEKLGEQRREYLVEMLVQPGCRLIGQSVEAAGLRHLPGLFLIEMARDGVVITPVTPHDVIRENDRLIFTGVVTTIVDLEKIPGLVPAVDMTYEVHPRRRQGRHLTEVVLSSTSPLIGATVREANFRQLYNAAVVAVHRNGARLTNKIGDISLEPGDTLLLQTRTEFVETYRHSQDFYLVSRVEGSRARRHDRAWLAAGLFLVMVFLVSFEGSLPASSPFSRWTSPAIVAMAIATLMVLTRCLPMAEARGALDLQVLFTIAAALALGQALHTSGADKTLADVLLLAVGPEHPYLLLIVIYLATMVLTEFLSNTAVVALMFPLVVQLAESTQLGDYPLSPRPFVMGITLAASLSFLTPLGYQTNLMVMGPGGYRPSDYLKVGAPLTLVVTAVALLLIPWVWPLAL
ncbi:MAG: SLC13 family permease [Planctomycetes bacterium]|nr:SLC13 family permease [Planctomycetota bacterium]